MMIAMCWGTCISARLSVAVIGALDLQDLGFLAHPDLVGLADELVGDLLQVFEATLGVVLRDHVLLLELLDAMLLFATDVADGNAGLLDLVLDDLDQLLTAGPGEGGGWDAGQRR